MGVALKPTVIIDMICFTVESCRELIETLLAEPSLPLKQFIHTGSIWAYGPSITVPTTEDGPHAAPLGEYGHQKRCIEHYLLRELKEIPFTCTVFHPGHIVGRGWAPVNPQGNFQPRVFTSLKNGESVMIPNLGMETVHHIHADDIASAFLAAMSQPDRCAGQAYSIVSPQAVSLRGFAEQIVGVVWPDGSPTVKLHCAPCPGSDFEARVQPGSANLTLEHIRHSPCSSVDKLRRDLGFCPRWSSLDAVADSVRWMLDANVINTIDYPGKDADLV